MSTNEHNPGTEHSCPFCNPPPELVVQIHDGVGELLARAEAAGRDASELALFGAGEVAAWIGTILVESIQMAHLESIEDEDERSKALTAMLGINLILNDLANRSEVTNLIHGADL